MTAVSTQILAANRVQTTLRGRILGGFDGGWKGSGAPLEVRTPIDGSLLATISGITQVEFHTIAESAADAFSTWRSVPAPKRGEIVRQLGEALRAHKRDLGALVSLENGKIRAEGEGEVQEMIDICDFAVGLSRMLNGLTMPSERRDHTMRESWHPLGSVGVITAFNFPVAVWAWNAALALICGDPVIWKPSSKTPLTAIACTKIAQDVLARNGVNPAVLSLIIGGGNTVGEWMIHDDRIVLISATGSCKMGERVAGVLGARLAHPPILELGGNNAVIVSDKADLDAAIPAILFGAVGTAGQRCTSIRRIIVHKKIRKEFVRRLIAAYKQVSIGNPLREGTLMGPLIDRDAVESMQRAIATLEGEGGSVLYGGKVLHGRGFPGGCYVTPCIAEAENRWAVVQEETFAPIAYLIEYDGDVENAVTLLNAVPQGLSSSIFSTDMREVEFFLSERGSRTGIRNVNIGPSGAEIGGAFGGNWRTGWGRESGSDSWKQYMTRHTDTVYFGRGAPSLSQGIRFGGTRPTKVNRRKRRGRRWEPSHYQ